MGHVAELNVSADQQADKSARRDSVPRWTGEQPIPLSFSQEQIWLHTQLVPDIPIYNEPVTIRRDGTLDVPALERSLTEIVRRHPAWRTTFAFADGDPVQVIQPVAPVHLPVVDLSDTPFSQRESEALRLAREAAVRPFDLSRDPLFRGFVVHLSEMDHSVRRPVPGSTKPEMLLATWPTEILNCSAVLTTRSRSAGFASNWRKLKRPFANMTECGMLQWQFDKRVGRSRCSWPLSSRRTG